MGQAGGGGVCEGFPLQVLLGHSFRLPNLEQVNVPARRTPGAGSWHGHCLQIRFPRSGGKDLVPLGALINAVGRICCPNVEGFYF